MSVASNIPSALGTFVDGQLVSANDATYGLNPKLETIRTVVNDHADRIDTLTGQISQAGALVYNVAVYGADPTGVTDSTTAIQNAINAAVAEQGIVVFSNGIYKITGELTISGTCYLTSDGAGQGVTIFQTTASTPIFTIASSYVRITDLKMDVQATTGTASVINAVSPTLSTLYGVFVQRCQVYSTTSAVFNGIYFRQVVGGAITDCTITGESTYSSKAIQLADSSNILISRNTLSTLNQAVSTTYAISAVNTANQNLIIEQNIVSTTKVDSFSIAYTTNVYVEKNTMATISGTVTTYAFVNFAYCSQIGIYDNKFNHYASATTFRHFGVHFLTNCDYPIIARNYFLYGGISIYTSNNITYLQILNNVMLEPNAYAILLNFVSKSCLVLGNTIIDVWSSFANTSRAIGIQAGDRYTIVGNTLVRGTKSATSVNYIGLYSVSATAPILYQSNNFSAATVRIATSTDFKVYNVEPTGAEVYYGTAAPTTGTWVAGTKVLLATPAAGGYSGYICTTAGTPGTWKGFGAIQA